MMSTQLDNLSRSEAKLKLSFLGRFPQRPKQLPGGSCAIFGRYLDAATEYLRYVDDRCKRGEPLPYTAQLRFTPAELDDYYA